MQPRPGIPVASSYAMPMQGVTIQAGRPMAAYSNVQAAPTTVYPAAQPLRTVAAAPTYVGTATPSSTYVGAASAAQPRPFVSGASPQVYAAPTVQSYSASGYTIRPQTVPAQPGVVSMGRVLPAHLPTVQPNVVAGPAYTVGAYEEKHKEDHQLQNLKNVRKVCGLKDVPVSSALQTFKRAGGDDGKLTTESFQQAYCELLTAHGIPIPPENVQKAVFELFDRDDNKIVDLMELICGVSLLCAGTEDDKIHAVFNVFDENGDGFISMDEMYKFLTSVFKVVLTPNVMAVMNTMGVQVESAEDLASVTALECFKTADLNHDGKLSMSEFKSWFYAPRHDPAFLFAPVRKMLQ